MTGIGSLIVFIIIVAAVVVVSAKLKINIGLVGFLAAYILGTIVLKMSNSEIIALRLVMLPRCAE